VTADPSGALWIGTRSHGLFCWKENRLVNWGPTNELAGKTIHTMQIARTGDLWIGEENSNAVQRLRAGKLTTLEAPPKEDLRVVRAMTEDAGGTIWVGTSRGLLLRVEGDRLVRESGRAKSPPISIRCLYATTDGSVWIGYAGSGGGGVGRFKDGKLAIVGAEQGLFDDFISHIVADGHGWLWFGGDRGLFKVRQQDLDDRAEQRISRVRSIHFGVGEGLPSLQATFGAAPAAMRSRDGRLWIPMRTALAVVYPDRWSEKSDPPPVVLHRVTVDEHTVAFYGGAVPNGASGVPTPLDLGEPGAVLRLPPGHRRVHFAFSALSFSAPENIHLRYRLDDSDDEWREAGTERSADYSRLPAGKYRFRVTACGSDGVWTEPGASFSFTVLPFFWRTWWFGSVLLAAFTLTVIAIVRYVSFRRLRVQMLHLEQQATLHKERARIAKDIHDDLGANLTQIALLGELARQDRAAPEKAGEHVEKISATARQTLKSLDEIVWAVNPRNDTLAHLIDYAGQFALDYLRVAGIRCRLDLPAQVPPREVSTDVRHNLFLVVKEAINNVVKHARATEVWLRVTAADSGLQIAIEDNGCGFDRPAETAGADGLRNMRQRVEEIGGVCRIESRADAGTRVRVELPWPRA
jgi:signal transduction histidine kinase